ncbi:MAG: hypothetical protein QM486_09985 [Flavobacteriaceae bacterium]
MKKSLLKICLLISIGLFMTSCFPTKQSCGLAHIEKTVKKTSAKVLNVETITVEEAVALN